MNKKIVAYVFALIMLFTVTPAAVFAAEEAGSLDNFVKVNTYTEGQFSDVDASDWFADNVATAYKLGLMVGNSDTYFNSSGNITLAEAITMAARIHSVYTTGSESFTQSSPWYQVYINYAIENDIITSADINYTKAATRAGFAVILAGALPEKALSGINDIADGEIPDVSATASYASAVYMFYRAGILSGNDKYGTFVPDSAIGRNAAAAIVTRLADISLRVNVELEKAVNSIILSDSSLIINKGSSKTLTATFLPADITDISLSWSSSDSSVATVSKGIVTGISEGPAIITATTVNGKSASCNVSIVSDNKNIQFNWEDNYCEWTYTIEIPTEVYIAYKAVDRNLQGNYYNLYVTDTADDKLMGDIAKTFYNEGVKNGYDDYQIIELMISFVQSLDYVSDDIGTGYDEYPKFPLETLYDKGGDCEDTSILLASLIRELGYGVVLVMFDNHMGVAIIGESDMAGYYYEYNGSHYYYVETTSPGWKIGELPSELIGKEAIILPT